MKLKCWNMKNVQKVCWLLVISVLALVFYVQAAGAYDVVDMTASFPRLPEWSEKCSPMEIRGYTIPGHGVVTTKVWETPYEGARDWLGGQMFQPYLYQYKTGDSWSGWAAGVPYSGKSISGKSLQNGMPVTLDNIVTGVAVYTESVVRQESNIVLEVALVPLCRGNGRYGQVQQELRMIIEFTPDSETPAPAPTTAPPTTAVPVSTAAQSGTGYDNGMGAPGGSVIYSNGNAGGVYNNPTSQTTFTLTNTYNVMSISTYHYNSGRGATPGTISLKDSSGKTVGTWTATGRYRNFYWDVTPNIKLGPGTYTVIDSDTSTWAQNSETNNQGMFIVKGTLATTTGITPDKGTTTVTAKRTTPKPGATTPQGDFTVSISPTEMTVNPGENIRFTLTVEPEGDFNEPVEIYVMTEALGQEKNFGRVKTIYPPYKPYVFESAVPDSIPKGTTITGYVTAKGGGLERDAGTVIVNVPGFGALLAIGALGMAILLRKRR